MHEMSIVEGILQPIEGTALRESAPLVSRVVLEIGPLASVETESLHFCFDAVSHGSVAEGARQGIRKTPGAGGCLDRSQRVALREKLSACPLGGSYRVQVTGGTAMRVLELEIE